MYYKEKTHSFWKYLKNCDTMTNVGLQKCFAKTAMTERKTNNEHGLGGIVSHEYFYSFSADADTFGDDGNRLCELPEGLAGQKCLYQAIQNRGEYFESAHYY